METCLRLLRILQAALFGSLLLYGLVGEIAGPKEARDVKQMQLILMVLAAASWGVIFFVRQRLVQPAEEILRTQPEDAAALGRWRAGNMATFFLAEAVALYGLVLRMLGSTLLQAAPFYSAAILLLLAFTPRRPQ